MAALLCCGIAEAQSWHQNGLIAWYSFNQATLADSSGNSRHLSSQQGVQSGTDHLGQVGQAVVFGGGNDHMLGNSNGLPKANTNRTLSVWILPTAFPDQLEYAFAFFYGNMALNAGMGLGIHQSGRVLFAGYTDNAQNQTPDLWSTNSILLDQWVHLVLTYENGMAKMYLNGQLEAQGNKTWNTGNGHLNIGRMGATGGGQTGGATIYLPAEVVVDEFRIYDRALSPTEIDRLFTDDFTDTTSGTSVQNLVVLPLQLYPNPATDVLNLRLEDGGSEATYVITDLQGRELLSGRYEGSLDVSALPAGMYVTSLRQGSRFYRGKFVKR